MDNVHLNISYLSICNFLSDLRAITDVPAFIDIHKIRLFIGDLISSSNNIPKSTEINLNVSVPHDATKEFFTQLLIWQQYIEETTKDVHVCFAEITKQWNERVYWECMNDLYSSKFYTDISFN